MATGVNATNSRVLTAKVSLLFAVSLCYCANFMCFIYCKIILPMRYRVRISFAWSLLRARDFIRLPPFQMFVARIMLAQSFFIHCKISWTHIIDISSFNFANLIYQDNIQYTRSELIDWLDEISLQSPTHANQILANTTGNVRMSVDRHLVNAQTLDTVVINAKVCSVIRYTREAKCFLS